MSDLHWVLSVQKVGHTLVLLSEQVKALLPLQNDNYSSVMASNMAKLHTWDEKALQSLKYSMCVNANRQL